MTTPPEEPYGRHDPETGGHYGAEPYGNQPYRDQAYGHQPYGVPQGTPPESRSKGLAITALVLGALALFFCWTVVGGIVLGLAAIVVGIVAASRASQGRAAGKGMAITGVVLGVIGAVLAGILVWAGASLLNSESGQNLQECLEDAGDDQAAVADCRLQFEEDLQERLN